MFIIRDFNFNEFLVTNTPSMENNREVLIAPNISTVPQYSPFRYPGGKSRYYPFVTRWFRSLPHTVDTLIEPFAGGAHAALTSVIEDFVQSAVLVELDNEIANVWRTILGCECSQLISMIANFNATPKNAAEILETQNLATAQKAFQTLLRNRISRAGITAPGAGYLLSGEGGKGLFSRWYPETLISRIQLIHQVRTRIQLVQGNGLEIMGALGDKINLVFFVDPPYPHAGRRLYTHFLVEPQDVFQRAHGLAGDFLITYGWNVSITSLIHRYALDSCTISVSNAHHNEKTELLIGRDLSWVRKG